MLGIKETYGEPMIDRGIGLAGIALALITGLSQYLPFILPDWFLLSGFILGVLLFGISLGLISTARRKSKLVDTALLRLHIYNDTRTDHYTNTFRDL